MPFRGCSFADRRTDRHAVVGLRLLDVRRAFLRGATGLSELVAGRLLGHVSRDNFPVQVPRQNRVSAVRRVVVVDHGQVSSETSVVSALLKWGSLVPFFE